MAERLAWMKSLDMAVVVSQGQNEIDDLKAKGLDIVPHRKRMQGEDLETRFKNAEDPLRLVFVCAMWITGFDVPTCSTVYLDKPMKNHTLMQTIARANRRARARRRVWWWTTSVYSRTCRRRWPSTRRRGAATPRSRIRKGWWRS